MLGALERRTAGPGPPDRASTRTREPSSRRCEAADPDRDGWRARTRGRSARREQWDHYRSDGAVHATYWIGGWPRVDVSPMFMDALLGRSNVVRTVAVTFEPLAPERSTREVEAAITRDRADRELRRRFGQAETARQRQAAGGHRPPRGRARRRPRRGPAGGLRDRLAAATRRSPPRLRGGPRAGGSGAPRAAPDVRPAGRRVHLHAAAVPGAAMSRAAERPGHRCTTRHAQAIYPFMAAGGLGGRGVFIGRDSAAARSVLTRGSSTATARSTTRTRSCSASSGRARARW